MFYVPRSLWSIWIFYLYFYFWLKEQHMLDSCNLSCCIVFSKIIIIIIKSLLQGKTAKWTQPVSSLKTFNYIPQQREMIFVKASTYSQQLLFCLNFFFPVLGWKRTCAVARGQAKPVRPASEQWTMFLLLTLPWPRSSVNIVLPTIFFIMSSLLVHLSISTYLSEHNTGLCFLAACSVQKCLSLLFPVWMWHYFSKDHSTL